jgi:NADH-quinone oxidoreductase subunit G
MSDEQKIAIEVDGQSLQASPGQMLIEVTDEAGIPIPRFCYHKHLSVAANCRMCLVEVERAPKPLPACATPVADGMKVFTQSPLARAAQKGTMEFLLINHPLDCPICDQGGECELQDVAMGYGGDVSRFTERKRVVPDPDIGPLVSTDMTRCIHCTRCVRFGEEIAGLRELGATGRGEHTKIGTYVKQAMTSELSGNVIDLCPVGALTSKPFRYQARAWELMRQATIAPHDSLGSNLFVHSRRGEVLRVVPKENADLNETWISDRDRFSYSGIRSSDRLTLPLIKDGNKWRETDWQSALLAAAKGIKSAVENDASQFGALISPKATLEEAYLTQKVTRGLGSQNIDHRLRMGDFRASEDDPTLPWLGMSILEVEQLDALLMIGSDLRREQPMLNHRVRKAVIGGAQAMALNVIDYAFNYDLAVSRVVGPEHLVAELAGIAAAVGASHPFTTGQSPSESQQKMADSLKEAQRGVVWLGNTAQAHPDFTIIRGLASAIAQAVDCTLGLVPEATNSVGAWLAGAVPHRLPGAASSAQAGLSVEGMIEKPRDACLMVDFEPDADVANPADLCHALESSGFVVALSPYRTAILETVADVMLPMAAFSETSGTFVNAEGRAQSFAGIAAPLGEARPAWKILRVLGNMLSLDGFDFDSSEQVRDEVMALCSEMLPTMVAGAGAEEARLQAPSLGRIGTVAANGLDGLCRRAEPLHSAQETAFRLHPESAQALGLADGDRAALTQDKGRIFGNVRTDTSVPEQWVWYPSGNTQGVALGGQFGLVQLEKA